MMYEKQMTHWRSCCCTECKGALCDIKLMHLVCNVFCKKKTESYTYYGTNLDSRDHLNYNTNQGTSKMAARAAQLAGLMALRLTYTQVLEMDMNQFRRVVGNAVNHVYKRILSLTQVGPQNSRTKHQNAVIHEQVFSVLQSGMLKDVDKGWLSQALGSCMRATMSITTAMVNTDPDNHEACRILNNRIMRVKRTP